MASLSVVSFLLSSFLFPFLFQLIFFASFVFPFFSAFIFISRKENVRKECKKEEATERMTLKYMERILT